MIAPPSRGSTRPISPPSTPTYSPERALPDVTGNRHLPRSNAPASKPLPRPIDRDAWVGSRPSNAITPGGSGTAGNLAGGLAGGLAGASAGSSTSSTPWRDRARREANPSVSNGLYPSDSVAPRAPWTGGESRIVTNTEVVGGVVYSGSYFQPASSSSSSFSLSLFLGGGWGGLGFSYSSGGWGGGWGGWNNWCAPAYGWSACGGWVPYCGWSRSRWCGWSSGCVSPWWRSCTWWDPWCASVAWPVWVQPSWALCFGGSAYTASWVYAADTFQPPPPPVVDVQPPAVVLASADQAWALLAAGYDQQAMSDFFELGQAQPGNPGHEVGYALSQAFLGLDESAVVAMRQALRSRAEALLLVPTDETLRRRLHLLADRLRDRARTLDGTATGQDALFLLAAVQAILYDNANAYFSINRAIELGDRDPASMNLKNMVQARLEQAF